MRHAILLSVLAAMVLVTGCKQQEPTTPPTPPPPPVVSSQQEQAAKEEPQPSAAEKPAVPETTVPAVAPSPPVVAPPPPVKTAPVETAKITPPPAPPTVTYKATNGNVTFDHQQHAVNNACSSCHPSEPSTKIILGKDKAHQLCKGCHQEKGAGPTQCTGCHIKG